MGDEASNHPRLLYRFRSTKTSYFQDEMTEAIKHGRHYASPIPSQNDPFEALPVFIESKPKEVIAYLKEFESAVGKQTYSVEWTSEKRQKNAVFPKAE